MKLSKTTMVLVCFVFGICNVRSIAFAQSAPPEPPLANVEGNWSIYSKDFDGHTATKSVQLKQDGNKLTGHFKGPNQSGGIEGTINGKHIVFRTKTRDVLTFRGRIQGDKMSGNFGNRGRHGTWVAERTSF